MEENDPLNNVGEVTATFERDLEALILEAFTKGADLEGTWDIELAVDAAPNWTIEISKTSTAKAATDDLEFITD